MYIEITKEAFKVLVPIDQPNSSVKEGELARRIYYYSNGVKLQTVNNYISGTMQYYIQDINA
jgi:hypothetical protein